MEKYWQNRPQLSPIATPPTNEADTPTSASVMSDYDQYRLTLVANEGDEGWQSEKRRYLQDMPADVTPETDIILYWQVCYFFLSYLRIKVSLHVEQSQTLSHPWAYCSRHPPNPCVFCSLRTSLFCCQGNC